MACPYFFPTEKNATVAWGFPHRLPLGGGFCGVCTATAERHAPEDSQLREMCNLGYARNCPNVPAERSTDAVRFAVARDMGSRIRLHYSCERNHAPVEHGVLEYDCVAGKWPIGHQSECIQRQAECFVGSYLEKRPR